MKASGGREAWVKYDITLNALIDVNPDRREFGESRKTKSRAGVVWVYVHLCSFFILSPLLCLNCTSEYWDVEMCKSEIRTVFKL